MVLDIALHGNGEPVRVSDIAERQNISFKYLEKLTVVLKKAGYIKSKRGPRGGHELAKPLDKISIGEIVRVLEEDYALTRCVATGMVCTRYSSCLMYDVWHKASRAMMDELDSISLADLVSKANKRKKNTDACAKT